MSDSEFPVLGFDPARGDVPSVRDLAEQLNKTGTYAKEAHEVLASVEKNKDVWTGQAAEAFAAKLDRLPEFLDKGQESLDKAGKALSTWADQLAPHQKKAHTLEEEAKKAKEEAESLDAAAGAARENAAQQPDNAELQDQAGQQARDAEKAWDKLAQIREKAKSLRDTWQSDADTCADALKKAAEAAPQESFWESLSGMWSDTGDWFAKNLGNIGDIAGIVSAVAGALAFIPVLTPICGPIAIGAGAVALGLHGADMAVNDKWNDPNAWIGLGGDVLGLVPGVGAIGKGFGAASDALTGADRLVDVTRATGAVNAGTDAVTAGTRAVGEEFPRVVSDMKNPSAAAQWVADKAMGPGALASPETAANVAKSLEGGTSVGLQAPAGAALFDTSDSTTDAKNAAGAGSALLGGITLK